jgi:hypothetical protein
MVGHQAALFHSANASNSTPSGRFFDRVMIQDATQGFLALNLRFERDLAGSPSLPILSA